MKKHILIAFFLFSMISGCGIFSKKSQIIATPVPAATPQRVVVDPKSLELCKPLPELQTPATYETIAEHYITTIGLYGECVIKQSSAVELIRKLSNLDNP